MSSCAYGQDYKLKPIAEQVGSLRELFPNIGSANEKVSEQILPMNAEGWFAIPLWSVIAPRYDESVVNILDLMSQVYNANFQNHLMDKLGQKYFRQNKTTETCFKMLSDEQQGSEILIVPAQFGLNHRGRSARRARAVFATNEFGLGVFAVGIMLLTHPQRLARTIDLWIDCVGDECNPTFFDDFSYAPYFQFSDGQVKLKASSFETSSENSGAATGFINI